MVNNKRNKRQQFGIEYKEHIPKMPGGFGIIAWDTFNCLNPIQTVVWMKICETAFKSILNNKVSIGVPWLRRNFASMDEWPGVIRTVYELEELGFIECDVYKASITARIDFETLRKVTAVVGRQRGAGMRMAGLGKPILWLTNEDLKEAVTEPNYATPYEDLEKIIDGVYK